MSAHGWYLLAMTTTMNGLIFVLAAKLWPTGALF